MNSWKIHVPFVYYVAYCFILSFVTNIQILLSNDEQENQRWNSYPDHALLWRDVRQYPFSSSKE